MWRKGDVVAWLAFFATRGAAVAIALLLLSRHGGTISPSPWGGYAEAIRHGLVPYRDFDVLYPPGLLALSAIGSWLPASAFHTAVILVVFASEVATLAILRQVPGIGALDPARAYVLVVALAPLQLIVLYGFGAFYDPLPACALCFSLYLLREDNDRQELLALVFLAMAILLKTYPVVVAPFVLIYVARRRGSRWALAKAGATLAALVVVPTLVLCALDAHGVLDSYRYLGRRAVEWESTPGLLTYLAGGRSIWLWPDSEGFTRHLSNFGWGFVAIAGPSEQLAVRATTAVFIGGMLCAIFLAWRRSLTWSELVRVALAVVVLLMGTSRVFSPLYVTWLFPLLALTQTDSRRSTRWIFVLGAGIGALTTVPALLKLHIGTASVGTLVGRSVLMLALLALIGWTLWRTPSLRPTESPERSHS